MIGGGLPVGRVRRASRHHGAARAPRARVPGGHAVGEPARHRGRPGRAGRARRGRLRACSTGGPPGWRRGLQRRLGEARICRVHRAVRGAAARASTSAPSPPSTTTAPRRTDEAAYAAFFHAMLDRGVALAPGPTRSLFLSHRAHQRRARPGRRCSPRAGRARVVAERLSWRGRYASGRGMTTRERCPGPLRRHRRPGHEEDLPGRLRDRARAAASPVARGRGGLERAERRGAAGPRCARPCWRPSRQADAGVLENAAASGSSYVSGDYREAADLRAPEGRAGRRAAPALLPGDPPGSVRRRRAPAWPAVGAQRGCPRRGREALRARCGIVGRS